MLQDFHLTLSSDKSVIFFMAFRLFSRGAHVINTSIDIHTKRLVKAREIDSIGLHSRHRVTRALSVVKANHWDLNKGYLLIRQISQVDTYLLMV